MCSCIAQLVLGGFCVNAEFHQCTKEFVFFIFLPNAFFPGGFKKVAMFVTNNPCSQGVHAIRVAQSGRKQLKNVDTSSIA